MDTVNLNKITAELSPGKLRAHTHTNTFLEGFVVVVRFTGGINGPLCVGINEFLGHYVNKAETYLNAPPSLCASQPLLQPVNWLHK